VWTLVIEEASAYSSAGAALIDHCTLDICGEGHLEAFIRKTIESTGLSERVRLHGRVDRGQCLIAMRSSDALLFTSCNFDTQGLVLLEAAAMSLPVFFKVDESIGC
jgi:glycosyltransferase involved in cell wall biosynthesis